MGGWHRVAAVLHELFGQHRLEKSAVASSGVRPLPLDVGFCVGLHAGRWYARWLRAISPQD